MTSASEIEALWREGKHGAALDAARQAVDALAAEPNSPALIELANRLQVLAEEAGATSHAESAVRLATTIRRRAWTEPDPQAAHASQGLIAWYVQQARYAEAEAELATARSIAERQVAQNRMPLQALLGISADVAERAGRLEDALTFVSDALKLEQARPRKGPRDAGSLYRKQAYLYERAGRLTEAAAALASSLREPGKRLSGSEQAEVFSSLAGLRERLGQIAISERLLERAIELCAAELGSAHPHTVRHRESLARLRSLR